MITVTGELDGSVNDHEFCICSSKSGCTGLHRDLTPFLFSIHVVICSWLNTVQGMPILPFKSFAFSRVIFLYSAYQLVEIAWRIRERSW